jgi:8-oxo-dGTP diphosphatase
MFGWKNLKRKVKYEPIGFNLLPKKFTLLQLQELYEAILEVSLDKPNFRRKIMKMGLLLHCNEKQKGVSHRAASLYQFDGRIYKQLKQEGFIFEF